MDAIDNNLTSATSSYISTDHLSLSNVNFSFAFQFWFSLICEIPSLICYFFVITYILTQKAQRQALHNHSILVLLFIALSIVLFDYSRSVDSSRREGKVWPAIPILCQIWWLLDFGFYDACTVILAWASFERHIIIFHSNLIATRRKRLFFHYLPLMSILIYLIIFYTYVIFFPPCENHYDFTSPICGADPCYLTIQSLSMWDIIAHGITATFLIVFFNIALLGRVIWQKHRHRQDWKKCRKMAFQLLSVSALYLSMNLPLMIIATVHIAGYPEWGVEAQRYLFFFCGLIQLFLPFICLTSLPGIWHKMKICFIRDHRRVMPILSAGRNQERRQESRM